MCYLGFIGVVLRNRIINNKLKSSYGDEVRRRFEKIAIAHHANRQNGKLKRKSTENVIGMQIP